MKNTSILILIIGLAISSCQPAINRVTVSFHAPAENSVVTSNLDSVLIDFDISASIYLDVFKIGVWTYNAQYDVSTPIHPYDYLEVSPSSNTHHFTGYIDLSSYPSGTYFTISVHTQVAEQTHTSAGIFVTNYRFRI